MKLANRAHYDRAPIVEALIAFECEPVGESQLPVLAAISDGFSSDFPNRKPRFRSQIAFRVGPDTDARAANFQDGFVCSSADGRRLLQLHFGGVVASLLAPYTRWEDLEPLALAAWAAFEKEIDSRVLTIGIRFVNKLEVPAGEPIERYLLTYPQLTEKLPQLLNQYFIRLELPIDDGVAILQQTFVPSDKPKTGAILFDIDVRVDTKSGRNLEDLLEYGHQMKNNIFEASITDELRKLIT